MVKRDTTRRWFPRVGSMLAASLMLAGGTLAPAATPLTTLEYRITGSSLSVSPAVLSVPKGIAGSIAVDFTGDPSLTKGAYIAATLRGPSFPAREILGAVGAPLLLPPLHLVGDYQLDNLRLARLDGEREVTLLEGSPSSVSVRVFDEVLVSTVTSRPLTSSEIREKGIVIDEQNFRAVEFEVGFVLDGKSIPVRLPVVAPRFTQSTEIIPAAELEERLKRADEINKGIDLSAQLPEELRTRNVNLDIQPINFQFVENGEEDLGLTVPPIPALLFIPGNIGFLNQFFSVQLFTENAAPNGSGLSVVNVAAELVLPPGPDNTPSTDFNQPGDDPLRFARVGANSEIFRTRPVTQPGPDGKPGTADDIARLLPGQSGQTEFLVEGLQEGLHVMNVNLTADLEGLAAGKVRIQGKAAGSVLVRNPKFSLAFTHPRTVRNQEIYEASVSILNTSQSPANAVRITLPTGGISGALLLSDQTVELGTIPPGQSGTARFRLRAQRTGSVAFSNLTTGPEATAGRFNLTMGVDERGVTLSPDSLGYPDDARFLPEAILQSADRVLGQALSAATAPILPAGVQGVSRSLVKQRVVELAEAGQRLRFGDDTNRVLADLLLDWQGGRQSEAGFDQILRETDAGREWRDAVAAILAAADGLADASERLAALGPGFAARTEPWRVVADTFATVPPVLNTDTGDVSISRSSIPRALAYGAADGHWLVLGPDQAGVVTWRIETASAPAGVRLLDIRADGTATQLTWTLAGLPPNALVRLDLGTSPPALRIDLRGDGSSIEFLSPGITPVQEPPPSIISARQDLTVQAGRPPKPCTPFPGANYGTVVGVLFSKPMTQGDIDKPRSYRIDNGTTANSVQIQSGGRLALLNLAEGISAIRPRAVSVTGIRDARGSLITGAPVPIVCEFEGKPMTLGVSVRGKVLRADGSVAAGIPVTVTMHDLAGSGFDCVKADVRVAQKFTDADGSFDFDFIAAGIPFSVAATDTSSLSPEAIQTLLEVGGVSTAVRQQFEDIAATRLGTLLDAFGASSITEAVAKAEGVDRAAQREEVRLGSIRVGGNIVVGLRFRGRGTATGTVLDADGITPVAGAAVNLFPDPNSRELGRGVFADSRGRFAFHGVPLGTFTVQADSGRGLSRSVSALLAAPGETIDVPVVLSAAAVSRGDLAGWVTEADGTTPHPGAQIFIGQRDNESFTKVINVVAMPTADANGAWLAAGIPAGEYDVFALSADGSRRGLRSRVQVITGTVNRIGIALQGFARVVGFVETASGRRVAGALVAGHRSVVTTDANGYFELDDVPTGNQVIHAGAAASPEQGPPKTDPAFRFNRLGSASLNVVPGQDNFAVIRFSPAGAVVGHVVDELGRPVPNVTVAWPQENGFAWVRTDGTGFFKFENLPPGPYTFSAPAGPVDETNFESLVDTVRNSDSATAIQAALNTAFAAFVGASDPFLNGSGAAFDPRSWGYTQVELPADNAVVEARIQFLRLGTVSGKVVNGQGVPIGAKVRIVGLGPAANGAPRLRIRGEVNSDAANGSFSFPDAILYGSINSDLPPAVPPGNYGLQAANPLFGNVIITDGGTLSFASPSRTNHVLQFPATREVNGALTVAVLDPDGTPAGEGVKVAFEGSTLRDLVLTTDARGVAASSSTALPAGSYTLTATNLANGLRGRAVADVTAGQRHNVSLRLLGLGSVQVLVVDAAGIPVPAADLDIRGGAFPYETGLGRTGDNGIATIGNLPEGPYAIAASFVTGPARIQGRANATIENDREARVIVVLQATGTIEGRFVRSDRVTPIIGAQVSAGGMGFVATDDTGGFRVAGLPLGTYRVTSSDPVTGRGAIAFASLAVNDAVARVELVEQSLGEITGLVIDGFRSGVVTGAEVTLSIDDGLSVPRTVTTGPDGRFSFPGTPAGSFSIDVHDPASGLRGRQTGRLPDNTVRLDVDVALEGLATLAGTVTNPDGSPARSARVVVQSPGGAVGGDTDLNGRVEFTRLRLGGYQVIARSGELATSRSLGKTNGVLETAGGRFEFQLQLRGVGSIEGVVLDSNGTTPVPAAEVILEDVAPILNDGPVTAVTDASGRFRFENVAVLGHQLRVLHGGLAAAASTTIENHGQTRSLTLVLSPSGSVTGRIVRADGSTAVPAQDVLVLFANQGGTTDRAFVATDAAGRFQATGIPVGPFTVEARSLSFTGLIRANGSITSNGQAVDLGTLLFDEAEPRVAAVNPTDAAASIPTDTVIDLLFSEALDPDSIGRGGILLRRGTNAVPFTTELLAPPGETARRLVRIRPNTRLLSLTRYDLLVLPSVVSGTGSVIGSGPTDLTGRPLAAPFASSFTTADNDPPRVVSIFPERGGVQVDPRAVMRVAFDEPVRNDAVATVIGPAGPVAGSSAVVLGGLAVTFTPAAALEPNNRYTFSISNVRDLAGNPAVNLPILSTFNTLDTLGPTIAELRIRDGLAPVAGRRVELEAVLTEAESGARIRFNAGDEFRAVGEDSFAPYTVPFQLPTNGSVTVRAIANDRFNNDGPAISLAIATIPNQPPVPTVTLVQPTASPVTAGEPFTLRASASDDVEVTQLSITLGPPLNLTTNFPNGAPRLLTFTLPTSVAVAGSVGIRTIATDFAGLTGTNEMALPFQRLNHPPVAAASVTSRSPGEALVLLGGTDPDGDPLTARITSIPASIRVFQTSDGSTAGIEMPPTGGAVTDPQGRVLVRAATLFRGTAELAFVVSDSLADSPPSVARIDLRDVTYAAIPGLFNSGVDDESKALADGAVDSHFRLVANADSAATAAIVHNSAGFPIINGPWIGNTADSRWIAPRFDTSGAAAGVYDYELQFTLTDLIPGTTEILGSWAVDDAGGASAILVNGVDSGVRNTTGFAALSPEFRLTEGFQSGLNRIVFRVQNNGGPTGLRIVGLRGSAVRESLFAGLDTDADGMPDIFELNFGLNPFDPADAGLDPDADSLDNRAEARAGTNPRRADSDGDTLPDAAELAAGTDPTRSDTDGDGIPDNRDIRPTEPNRPPVPGTDSITAIRNEAVRVSATTVLANDTDPEGEGVELIGVGPAAHGQTSLTSSGIEYQPETGFSGTDTFEYSVRDPHGSEARGVVLVSVPANRRPVADPTLQLAATQGAGSRIVPLGTDPDGDALATFITTLPTHGRLFQVNGDTTPSRGSQISTVPASVANPVFGVEYLPDPLFTGDDSFGFRVNDGTLDSSAAAVRITVIENVFADTDGDGLTDRYEVANGLNPAQADADGDLDSDTLSNRREFELGTAPNRRDTDGDGLDDNVEIARGTNPLNPDTDGDGIVDGADPNPLQSDADLDGDGIADVDDPDIDGDGLANTAEVAAGTQPRDRDTDRDGWVDGVEVEMGSDPLDPTSTPVLFAIAEPQVGIVLPHAPPSGSLDAGVIVGEPSVHLILPRSPDLATGQAGITIAEPVVSMILPRSPEIDVATSGLTVAEPLISIVLPASPATLDGGAGITVAEPLVALVLPAAPEIGSGTGGTTVAEPMVLLQFEPAPDSGGSGNAGGGSPTGSSGNNTNGGASQAEAPAVTLRLVRVDPSARATSAAPAGPTVPHVETPWSVELEWQGPDSGSYSVEASADLETWSSMPASLVRLAPGHFRARCPEASPELLFYRLRVVPRP